MNSTNIKILVCGGRDYANKEKVAEVLNTLHKEYTIERIIHGDANGADRLARDWALENEIIREEYPAKWKTFKKQGRLVKSAGPIRNEEMLKKSLPDLVVAFPGGRGTQGMITLAKQAEVAVIEVKE